MPQSVFNYITGKYDEQPIFNYITGKYESDDKEGVKTTEATEPIDTTKETDKGENELLSKIGTAAAIGNVALTGLAGLYSASKDKNMSSEYLSANNLASQKFSGSVDNLDAVAGQADYKTAYDENHYGKKDALSIGTDAFGSGLKGFSAGMKTGNPILAGGLAAGAALTSLTSSLLNNKRAASASDASYALTKNTNKMIGNNISSAALTANNTQNNFLRRQAIGNQFAGNGIISKYGGMIFQDGGMMPSDGSNEFNYIGAGGSHGENPNNGVQQGIAPDGQPNLVEEGETIVNIQGSQYVFSKRLKLNDPKKFNLPLLLKGKSFADCSLWLRKRAGIEDSPNSKANKDTNDVLQERLQQAQEYQKEKSAQRKMSKQFNSLPDEQKAQLLAQSQQQIEQPQVEQAQAQQGEMMPQTVDGQQMMAKGGRLFQDGNKIEKIQPLDPIDVDLDELRSDHLSIPLKTHDPMPFIDALTKASEYGVEKPEKKDLTHLLRYSNLIGAGVNAITDLAGITNKPDYRFADAMERSLRPAAQIGYSPVGQYMTATPRTHEAEYNQLRNSYLSTINAGMETTAGNAAAARNYSLLGLNTMSDKLSEMREKNRLADQDYYNTVIGQRNSVDQENAKRRDAISTANANSINHSNELLYKNSEAANTLRESIASTAETNKAKNKQVLYDSLTNIGKEAYNRNIIESLAKSGALKGYLDTIGNFHQETPHENAFGGHLFQEGGPTGNSWYENPWVQAFVPFTSTAADIKNGNYWMAAADAALDVAGLLPGVGLFTKGTKAAKVAKNIVGASRATAKESVKAAKTATKQAKKAIKTAEKDAAKKAEKAEAKAADLRDNLNYYEADVDVNALRSMEASAKAAEAEAKAARKAVATATQDAKNAYRNAKATEAAERVLSKSVNPERGYPAIYQYILPGVRSSAGVVREIVQAGFHSKNETILRHIASKLGKDASSDAVTAAGRELDDLYNSIYKDYKAKDWKKVIKNGNKYMDLMREYKLAPTSQMSRWWNDANAALGTLSANATKQGIKQYIHRNDVTGDVSDNAYFNSYLNAIANEMRAGNDEYTINDTLATNKLYNYLLRGEDSIPPITDEVYSLMIPRIRSNAQNGVRDLENYDVNNQ